MKKREAKETKELKSPITKSTTCTGEYMVKEYKYPVYRPEGKAQRVTLRMLKEMKMDQLLEELKNLCETRD
jgi:hypothetical protein